MKLTSFGGIPFTRVQLQEQLRKLQQHRISCSWMSDRVKQQNGDPNIDGELASGKLTVRHGIDGP